MTVKLLFEVCTDVKIEPELQPLTGELLQHKTANMEDGAKLDTSARGLLGDRHEKTFVNVRVQSTSCYTQTSAISACYRNQDKAKKRAYKPRVKEVEQASFTPLVFSATDGIPTEATSFYKQLV